MPTNWQPFRDILQLYQKQQFDYPFGVEKQKRCNDCVYIVGEMMNFMNEKKFRQIEKDLVINFILAHMVTAEVREDPETTAKLREILGRLEKIKVAKNICSIFL